MPLASLLDRVPFAARSPLPDFAGATGWINTEPVEAADLRGRVVLVDFCTYTCINWLRTLPHLRRWAEAYGDHGLTIVGVHTPEFSFEHEEVHVRRAAETWAIDYPIALDSHHAIWDAFDNQYWPAVYLADANGLIRHHLFGELHYERLERVLRRLLTDAGAVNLPDPAPLARGSGIEAEADWSSLRSYETYLGWARARGFRSVGGATYERPTCYVAPTELKENEWALAGTWTVQQEAAKLNSARGSITYRFHARDLNLVLSPASHHRPVTVTVRLDGEPPGRHHGLDISGDGRGLLDEPRLYQLVRQQGPVRTRLCEVEVRGPGAAAFCFTFG